MKNKLWNVFSLLMVFALVLAACATTQAPVGQTTDTVEVTQPTEAASVTEAIAVPTETSAPKPTDVPTQAPTATKAPGGTATITINAEFDNLNPLYTNSWGSQISQQLWNCAAWVFDENGNALPVTVKELPSVENGGLSKDGKTITIKLKDDIKWSDGEPITSKDFIFTHEMKINPANAVVTTYPDDKIKGIEAPDDQTVVMTFEEPFAPWLGSLWQSGLIPEHLLKSVFDKEGTLDQAEWNLAPTVGCGPFVFQEWESGSFVRFIANENYWLGRPKLDEIVYRFVPDEASQIAALTVGDSDIGTFIAYPDIPTLEKAGVQMVSVPAGYQEGMFFHMHKDRTKGALRELNVRKAIALATDRFSITKDMLLGKTKPAATIWDNTPWVDPSIQPWPYDPEQAKALLDEAGWVDSNGDGTRDKNGEELVLDYGTTTRQIRKDTQAVFQQQLAKVGIKVNLLNEPGSVFFASYSAGGPVATDKYDLHESSNTTAFPDPDISLWLCSEIPTADAPDGRNYSGLCDEKLDELFTKARSQVVLSERLETFHQISKYMFENVYWLGVWQDPDIWAVNPRLLNVKLSGASPFYNVMDWEVSK